MILAAMSTVAVFAPERSLRTGLPRRQQQAIGEHFGGRRLTLGSFTAWFALHRSEGYELVVDAFDRRAVVVKQSERDRRHRVSEGGQLSFDVLKAVFNSHHPIVFHLALRVDFDRQPKLSRLRTGGTGVRGHSNCLRLPAGLPATFMATGRPVTLLDDELSLTDPADELSLTAAAWFPPFLASASLRRDGSLSGVGSGSGGSHA